MKKLRKNDYIIMIVVLVMIAAAVAVIINSNAKKESSSGGSDTPTVQLSQDGAVSVDVSYKNYNGRKIGILTGTNLEAASFEYFPDSQYLYFDNYANLVTALTSGMIDAFLTDEPAAKSMHFQQPTVDYIKDKLTNNQYSFAFRKNDEAEKKLCGQLNEFLTKCREDGTIEELDSIWFGNDDSKKLVDMSGLDGKNGKIRVVTTSTDEPFSYIRDGKHVGYDIDVTVRFCREYGYSLEIGDVDFSARIPALASGKYDFTTSMNVTPEREEEVMFSDPVSEGGIVVVVRAKDIEGTAQAPAEASYKEFNGKNIGIRTGSIFEDMTFQYFPDSQYMYFDNDSDLVNALIVGKIDGFLGDEPVARMIHTEQPEVDHLKKPLENDLYSFGFPKNDERSDKIRGEFNEMMKKLTESGELEAMKQKWVGSDKSAKVVDKSGLTGENGELVIAVLSDGIPFSYIVDNELQGYAIELSTIFAREYGYSIDFEQTNPTSALAGLASGKYDILAGSISVTEERKETIEFSDTIYEGGVVFMARSADISGDKTGAALSDFNGKTAGVLTGSMHDDIVKKKLPESEMVEFKSYPDMIAAILADKIDYFLMGYEGIQQLMIENDELGYIEEPLDYLYVGAMFPKTEEGDKIREEFDEFINKIYADGTRDEIYAYWTDSANTSEAVDISDLTGENGTLVLATSGSEVPTSFITDGKPAGADVDIAARFCREYGYGLDIEIVDFGGVISGIRSGMYDFAMNDIVITEERKESVNFSVPYHEGRILLVARRSDLNTEEADYADNDEKGFFEKIKDSFVKNFIREDRYLLILQGVGTTCIITVLSVIFGSVLAFLICVFRRSDSVFAPHISAVYVKLLQGTPMVVLLMILYYVIFGSSDIEAIWVAVIGFSLNFAAYTSEILRSGIESVDSGQREAALALGFTENQSFFRFIFPQAAFRQIPVYKGEIVSLLKNTSIVGYIAIQDLTKMSDIIRSRTYEAFFPLIVTAIIYFILAGIITMILSFILKKLDPKRKKRSIRGVVAK
ncbi:MAG: ABC transporter permease subunit [Oscillospiraceae bacterium]|nr:ABC transporter permease subunit [Oscillospiraceae bacterium]